MSEEGYQKLVAELKHLEAVERPKVVAAIAEARDKGDLSENAEYDAAKEAQAMLEMKINQLKATIGDAKIIDTSKKREERHEDGIHHRIRNRSKPERRKDFGKHTDCTRFVGQESGRCCGNHHSARQNQLGSNRNIILMGKAGLRRASLPSLI